MSDLDFKYKIVLITGGAGGLGLAMAHEFAKRGARLALLDRNQHDLLDCQLHILSQGGIREEDVFIQTADISNSAQAHKAIAKSIKHFGGLDILINNAGISHRSLFMDTDTKVIQKVMDINFMGPVYASQAALPALIKNKGSLVGISSVAGFAPLMGRTGYCASKHALAALLETLRSELHHTGLHILPVYPSFIRTGLENNALDGSGSSLGKSRRMIGREWTAPEAARAIADAIAGRKSRLILSRTAKLAFLAWKYWPWLYRRRMEQNIRPEFQGKLYGTQS